MYTCVNEKGPSVNWFGRRRFHLSFFLDTLLSKEWVKLETDKDQVTLQFGIVV